MSDNLTRRQMLFWGLGFGASLVAAGGVGAAIGKRDEIMQRLGLSEPEIPQGRVIDINTASELADIVEKSKDTPVFIDMATKEYDVRAAFHDVSKRYKEVLFAHYKQGGPELPKELGSIGMPNMVVLYQGDNHIINGEQLSRIGKAASDAEPTQVGKKGGDAFEVIVEDNLRLYRPKRLVPLKESNYRGYLEMDKVTFVDLWAEWCVFCRPVKETFEGLAAEGYDQDKYQFATYDVDLKLPIYKEWGVSAIPDIAVVRNGKLVGPLILSDALYVKNGVSKEERKENLKKILERHVATYLPSHK